MRILDGEGQVYAARIAGSPTPVTVQVTDETGKPVDGASVSFHLPDDGAGGAFTGGMQTDIAISARGRQGDRLDHPVGAQRRAR